METHEENLFSVFLPEIDGHLDSPQTKLPFTQTITITVYSRYFDALQRELINVCTWNEKNLSGARWYIEPKGLLIGEFKAAVEFNFSTEEDAIAFKLRWT